ncbi:MAG: hypothetical protein ABI647_03445 [Gemmatimonadota bacterium]
MCTQSVGLLAGVLEASGIATVCIALLRGVAVRMGIPRALAVPFPFGAPLGGGGRALRLRVVSQGLALLGRTGPGPILVDFAVGQSGEDLPGR